MIRQTSEESFHSYDKTFTRLIRTEKMNVSRTLVINGLRFLFLLIGWACFADLVSFFASSKLDYILAAGIMAWLLVTYVKLKLYIKVWNFQKNLETEKFC